MKPPKRWRRAVTAASALAAVVAWAMPAVAVDNGSISGQVAYGPIRSITVSAANPLPLTSCWPSGTAWSGSAYGSAAPSTHLTSDAPNGFCISGLSQQSVTITNGGDAGHVYVGATNALGPGGVNWSLVTVTPGADQYALATYTKAASQSTNGGSVLGHQVQLMANTDCDTAFGAGSCVASSGQVGHEDVGLGGPSSSTVGGQYSFTITWTAVA